MKIIKLVIVLAAVMLGLTVRAESQTTVKFGLTGEGFIDVPFYIAESKGYFAREGITPDVNVFKGAPLTVQAGISGNIDVMVAPSVSTIIQAHVAKQDVRIFAVMVNQMASALVIQGDMLEKAGIGPSAPIADRLKLLKGLRIATTSPGSLTDHLARYFASSAGLDPDHDVTIVPAGDSPSMLAAFSRGRIDAFVLSSPTPETAVIQYNGKILVNLANGEIPLFRNYIYSCLAARPDWLLKNADTARRIGRAIASAELLIHENPEEAQDAVRSFFGNLSPAVFSASFQNNLPAFPASPRVDPAGIEAGLAFIAATEGKRPELNAEDLYTNDYLPQ